jgi:single-strand DNA-binding protein
MFECALIGTLGGDAEVKTSKAGKPYFRVNLATGNGEQTTWVGVSVFGDRATELAPTLKKGMQLYVTGRLTLDKWTGRDGHERTGISVAAGHIEPCEIGKQKQRPSRKPTPTPSPSAQQQLQPASIIPSDMNDDIPF